MRLRKFQKIFINGALAPHVRTAALSIPRGGGKSTLIAHLAKRTLTPGDPLFRSGTESFIFAASMGQARRTVFGILARLLDPSEYRVASGANNICSALHTATGTRITTLAANAKTSQGLVDVPWIFCDEPGSWETIGGEALFDAIQTAQGKPGPAMKTFFVGTLAPAQSGWWHDLVAGGSTGSVYVQALQADLKKWDKLTETRRVNPLMFAHKASREVLREELAAAKKDTRLKARFCSYRLNVPSQDTSAMLLAIEDWQRVVAREVPPRKQQPVVGVDLGGGRAWSAACAVWANGRVEALASAPGVPSIRDQERRDKVASGTYSKLVERGVLHVSSGKRVQPISDLVKQIKLWNPAMLLCDRFRHAELLDAKPGVPVQARVARWSDSSSDIRGLRQLALDGPLSIAPDSRALLQHSLSVSTVENDDAGNSRMVKKSKNNLARDDVAAALLLAAGALSRAAPVRVGKSWAVAR